MENNLSKIRNIFRGLYETNNGLKKIKDNCLKLIYKDSDELNFKIIVEFICENTNNKEDNETKLKMELKDFIEESNKNFFLEDEKEIVAFDNKTYYTQEYLERIIQNKNKNKNKKNKKQNDILINKYKKEKIIQPITNFDFYCREHSKKYTYYCLNCKNNLCSECVLEYSNQEKNIYKALKNIFCIAKESHIKITDNDNEILNNILKENKSEENKESQLINNEKKEKICKHIKIINLEEHKLSEKELKEYEFKIEQYSQKLKDSKETKRYYDNINLLEYCKMYIDFYKRNIDIGINYIIINIIRNKIKFNDKFLVQDNKQNNNELILNIPLEKVDNSIIFLNIIHKILYPEIDALNVNRDTWNKESIVTLFVSDDKTKFVVTFTTGFIKIYEIRSFQLLHNINFKEECKKSHLGNVDIDKEYFYAKYISNGNIIVTNCDKFCYQIKFEKNEYLIEKIFSNYNEYISFFIEIKENKHFITGGNKVNIYNYNYEKVSCLNPITDYYDDIRPATVKSLVYLSHKKILICLMISYGPGASRNSGITIFNTKHKLYKIIWGLEGVYPYFDSPYCIEIFNDKLIIFTEEIYYLRNGSYVECNCHSKWSSCKFGVCYKKNYLILKERFSNNLYEFDEHFQIKSRLKINGITESIDREGLIKMTEKMVCLFKENEIIFLK